MKNLIIIAAVLSGLYYVKLHTTSKKYKVNPLSSQALMLAEQDF